MTLLLWSLTTDPACAKPVSPATTPRAPSSRQSSADHAIRYNSPHICHLSIVYTVQLHYAPSVMGGGIKRCFCLTYLAYGGLTREQRPRKTKIGTGVAQVARDSDTTFKVKRSRSPGRFGSLVGKSLHDLYGQHHNHNQSVPLPVDHEYSWRKALWAPQA